MKVLKAVMILSLFAGLSAFSAERNKVVEDRVLKLVTSDEAAREEAIKEILSKTEAKDLAYTVGYLVGVKQTGEKPPTYTYPYSGWGHGYGYSYGVWVSPAWQQANLARHKAGAEAATRTLIGFGTKAAQPLMDLYKELEAPEILEVLAHIAEKTRMGDEKGASERAEVRKRIYVFLSESYMKRANERE